MSKFSEALKRLRKQHGYTQKHLSTLLEMSESAIGMYERGERRPDFETLEAIADVFNVRMSDLIDEKPAPQEDGLDDKTKLLLDLFNEFDDSRKDEILRHARLLELEQNQ